MPYGRRSVKAHSKSAGRRGRAASRRRNSATRRKAAQARFRLPKPRRSVVRSVTNMLETKKYQGLDYSFLEGTWSQNPIEVGTLPLTNAGISFMPDSFYRMQFANDIMAQTTSDDRALSDNCIEGTSIFSKYLTCKVQIDYPDGTDSPVTTPRPVEIIWGWVNPLNFTEFTNPRIDEVNPAQIRQHTLDMIAAEFNSSTDPMEFHDKHKRRYNIIGRRKMYPDLRHQVPTRAEYPTGYGVFSGKLHHECRFPMMKKVNYTRSEAKGDTSTPQFAYPNEAYLPFVYLYNPDYAMYDVSGVGPVSFKFNDCHWFNDA